MTLTNIDWTAIDWVSAGAYVLAAVLVIIMLFSLISAGTRGVIKATKGKKDQAPVVLAGIAALLASGMSIQAQWGFLEHNLGMNDDLTKSAFVGVFDIAAIAAALLSREARVRNPGKFGADALIVWAIAILLGWLGSTEATTTEGELARWAVPLVAALMWDRVIQRDVARVVSLDKARMATVSGRIAAAVGRAFRTVSRSIMRTLARLGLVQPDDDIAVIQHKRWHKKFISAAAAVTGAKRRLRTDPNDKKASTALANAEDKFAAVVATGQRKGAVATPDDLRKLLWDAHVVLNAADALDQADAESPWRTAGRLTDRTIDADVVDQPTEPVTDQPTEPTEPVDLAPTDRPDTLDRPTRSIAPAPTARPTNPAPVEPATDRPEAIEGEVIDRPVIRPTGRRTKEENESLVLQALAAILGDTDAELMPSQGTVARVATEIAQDEAEGEPVTPVSKSTVQAYCGRYGLTKDTVLDRELIKSLTTNQPAREHI